MSKNFKGRMTDDWRPERPTPRKSAGLKPELTSTYAFKRREIIKESRTKFVWREWRNNILGW